MDILKRVGEKNRDHWLVEIFGLRNGVILRILLRSLSGFIGNFNLASFTWIAVGLAIGKAIQIPSLQEAGVWAGTAIFLAVGLVGVCIEVRYMDKHDGKPRPFFK
jgi:hypothetical protein